jgi:hypothetical protein
MRENWHKILAVPLMASLCSGIIVGEKVSPTFPLEELLPQQKIIAKPIAPKLIKDLVPNELINCRMALQSRKRAPNLLENFLACDRAFSNRNDCSMLAKEYAETLYLLAYGLTVSAPHESRQMLLRSTPILLNCPESLPLRKRAFELLEKI